MILSRRGLIAGVGALLASPAIVRASSIMPVKAFKRYEYVPQFKLPPGYDIYRLERAFDEFNEIVAYNIFRTPAYTS